MWQKLFGIKVISLLGLLLLALLVFALAVFSIVNYQQLARQGLQQSARDLLRLKSQQHLQQLYTKQKQFAYRLQSEENFREALQQSDYQRLQQRLQLARERMDSRNDVMHLRGILVRDLGGEILAASHAQDSAAYNGCPLIIDRVKSASGTQRLKAKYALCHDQEITLAEVVVSVGSLQPRAYLHVIAYLKDEFYDLQAEIGMPVKLQNVDQDVLFQTAAWDDLDGRNPDYLPVSYTLYADDNIPGIKVTALKNVSLFNQLDEQASFKIMTVVSTATLSLLLLLGLLLLHAFKPVERIRKSAGLRLNGRFAPISEPQLPHELQEIVSAYNVMVVEQEDAAQKQQLAELELRRERDFISTTLDSITNAVIIIDAQMRIRLANPAAEALLDDSEETLKDYALDELVIMYTNRSATHIANLKQLLKTPQQLINLFFQRDDMTIELEMMASPMVDKETEEVGHVLIFKDVTEDRKLRRKLHFEGLQDALSGLLNRRAFEHRFDAMINEAEVTRSQHIMVYINLDQFRQVNDNSGTEAGDELLKRVAKTIQDRVRKSDSLARLSSDEFGILFPYARTDAAEKTVNEILRLIVQNGFNWQGREFHVTASASLIAFGHSNDRFTDMYQQLMDACLQAKENGGNQCVPVYA